MIGHDAIAKAVVDQGIDTTFGVVGDANVFIVDSLVRNHGLRYVAAAHESSALQMALGYARVTGGLGVATVTHGPGLTNAITPLVEGVRSNTPMLLLCGDTAVVARHHLQKIGQRELVLATGAGFEPVRSGETIALDVAQAVRRAYAERRPIVLDIPYDLEFVDVSPHAAPRAEPPALAVAPDPVALDRAVGIIASATRPLVLAGRGAVLSGARESLVRLAARLGAPVATTLMGRGLFEGDPFDLGIFGTLSTEVASEAIASADCIIAFGAGLNSMTTYDDSLLAGKRVVQCDLDPARLGLLSRVDAGVVGDAGRIADTIVAWLDDAEHKPSGFRSPELEARLRQFDPAAQFVDRSTDSFVDPRTLTLRLDSLLPAGRTVVVDGGRYMLNALRVPARDPMSFVTTTSFGSIGLGLGHAIGAATAKPDQPTVLLCGDGGFMMGCLVELNTAIQLGLDLTIVIYNDGSYGAEHIQFHTKNMDPALSLHRWPSFAAVASSMGATGVTVRNLGELDAAAAAVQARSGVVLIDVKLDPQMISETTPASH
ncbi:MAG: thiamine pyrophosphate-binding protein [Acidimicrobiales bacterium]|nr:thiamine pyrophosphate-binding protein [Acidimicrobiales bacterium]